MHIYIFSTSIYCSFRINRPNWLIYTVVGRSFYESPCIPGPSKKTHREILKWNCGGCFHLYDLICVHTDIQTYIHTFVHARMHTGTIRSAKDTNNNIYIYIYINLTYKYIHIYIYTFTTIYTYTFDMYIYIYICIDIDIDTDRHAYTHISWEQPHWGWASIRQATGFSSQQQKPEAFYS